MICILRIMVDTTTTTAIIIGAAVEVVIAVVGRGEDVATVAAAAGQGEAAVEVAATVAATVAAAAAVLAVEVVTAVIRWYTARLIADVLALGVNDKTFVGAVNTHTLLVAVKEWSKEVIARGVIRKLLAFTPVV